MEVSVLIASWKQKLDSGKEASISETKLFYSRYRGIETSNLSFKLEAKLRFWKRNVDPGNEASNLSYNKKLSYPKENFDLRNEALILKTKLQIWVAITSCKQSFEFELQSRMETKLWYEKETWILETKLRSSKLNFEFVFQKKKYWKQNFQWEF